MYCLPGFKLLCRPLLVLTLSAGLLLAACGQTAVSSHCPPQSPPPFSETAQVLAACLPPEATADEAATAAVDYLRRWQRLGDRHWGGTWGDALAAPILPGGNMALVLTYHADLTEVTWNPQGKIAILGQTADSWQLLFESLDPAQEQTAGAETLAGNWTYEVLAVGDVTGNGTADLLVEQSWTNGIRSGLRYVKLFTAVDGSAANPIRVITMEDASRTRPRYHIADRLIHATHFIYGQEALTRTYRLNGDNFALVAQTINAEAAVLSATTPDGSDWYSFDVEGTTRPLYGLYQVQNGRLHHHELPNQILNLQTLADGRLYVGSWEAVFRMEDGRLVDLLAAAELAPVVTESWWAVHDMALAASGDLWIAGRLRLLRLGQAHSQVYPYFATAVLVAPDQSVWVKAWDGQADKDCCYLHIVGEEITVYNYSESLPLSPELAAKIRGNDPP
jgi:hypothetical protein